MALFSHYLFALIFWNALAGACGFRLATRQATNKVRKIAVVRNNYNAASIDSNANPVFKDLVAGSSNAKSANPNAMTLEVTQVRGEDVSAQLKTGRYDIVVVPGGRQGSKISDLGERGLEAIRKFVANGGGFIGICAGAFLALNNGKDGLQLFPRPIGRYSDGTANQDVQISFEGVWDLKSKYPKCIPSRYNTGPVFYDKTPEGVDVLATFDQVKPYYPNRPAIVCRRPVKAAGDVVAISPHFEGSSYGPGVLYKIAVDMRTSVSKPATTTTTTPSTTVSTRKDIRVALYYGCGTRKCKERSCDDGTCTSCGCGAEKSNALRKLNAGLKMLGNVQTVDEVYYTDLATKLTRSKYDVIVFPDGSGHQQRKAIGEAGTAAVKKFVLNGGGYLGICAGAFSAIDAYGFLPDRKYVPGSQMRGKGRVNVEFTRSIVDEFGLTPADYKNASVAYANGPVLDAKSLPKSVSVLASFRTAPSHIAKEPQGKVMINQPAAVRTTFGKGRVVLFSPNFELGIHAKLFAGVVGWLSGLA